MSKFDISYVHEHKHEHKHRRNTKNPEVIFAAELASLDVFEAHTQLQIEVEGTILEKTLSNFKLDQKSSISNDDDFVKEIEDKSDTKSAEINISLDKILTESIGDWISNEEKERLLSIAKKSLWCGAKNDDLKMYGEYFTKWIGLKKNEKDKNTIAKTLLPIGMAWSNRYEYLWYLAKYLFVSPAYNFPEIELQSYTSYKIKKHYIEQLGEVDASELFTLLECFTNEQYQRYIKTKKKGRSPYSATAISRKYDCTLLIAESLIALYKSLPLSPLRDKLGGYVTKVVKDKNYISSSSAEFILSVDKKNNIKVRWSDRSQKEVDELKVLNLNGKFKAIKILASFNIDDFTNVDDVYKKMASLPSNSDAAECESLADQLLMLSGDQSLVSESNRINYEVGGGVIKEGFILMKSQMSKLRRAEQRYKTLTRSYDWKEKIISFVLKRQNDFLITGNTNDLNALTKADIIREIGFLPSSGGVWEQYDDDQKLLATKGRNLARHIKSTTIKLPDGKVRALDYLIPGCGGVKVGKDKKVSRSRIKGYITDIINQENKKKPLSARIIADTLALDYGVSIATRTVQKYRDDLGLNNSSDRRE